ncbi:Cof-type HAD-IIB family hydrolase [Niallia sp. 01092]|uniref:Cof-type HAD-IIB family hydrolase n=1 Tax=unclassified Niallia TaxID=2837522 RepID=UPI003FD2559F
MYKLIFSDIDGTLLNSNHQISEETQNSLKFLQHKGIPFALVSARMPEGIFPLLKSCQLNEPIICFSGALLLGKEQINGEREILYKATMKEKDVEEIYKLVSLQFPSVCFTMYSKDNWFVESLKDEWVEQEQEITSIIPKIFVFHSSSYPSVYKILCMGTPEHITSLEKELKKDYPKLSIYKSKATYLEIMAEGVKKSNAICILANQLGIYQDEIMAFGDNYNDIDMLKYAGLGVAMGNAPQIVKDAADLITSSNDEDGIVKVIDQYFSNKEQ